MNKSDFIKCLESYRDLTKILWELEHTIRDAGIMISSEDHELAKPINDFVLACHEESCYAELNESDKMMTKVLDLVPDDMDTAYPMPDNLVFLKNAGVIMVSSKVPGGELISYTGGVTELEGKQIYSCYRATGDEEIDLTLAEVVGEATAEYRGYPIGNRDIDAYVWSDANSEDWQEEYHIKYNDILQHVVGNDSEIYLELKSADYNGHLMRLLWSDNEPCNPEAPGVIGIYTYDENGEEDSLIEGGELDAPEGAKNLVDCIFNVFSFIGIPVDTPYYLISEEEFDSRIEE